MSDQTTDYEEYSDAIERGNEHCSECGEPMELQIVRNPTDSPVMEREEWFCDNGHLAVRNFGPGGHLSQRFGFAKEGC